jgi:hypothetical protein
MARGVFARLLHSADKTKLDGEPGARARDYVFGWLARLPANSKR